MISIIDFLYIVLAVGLIPTFTILCMILWRIFKMLDRIEYLLWTAEKAVNFARNLDRVPNMIISKIMSKFDK